MEQWQDQAIVLSARPHGESGAIVSLLTQHHGRHAGYVRGMRSAKNRGVYEAGNLIAAQWQSRVSDHLGTLAGEVNVAYASAHMSDALRLSALQAACALCDEALPEREGHEGLFHGLLTLFDALEGEHFLATYVMWELSLLRELGFSLDLTRCAGGGDERTLCYVSPKTGRAVSREAGAIYKDRLLALPFFLRQSQYLSEEDRLLRGQDEDIKTGLDLSGYFLEHWAFAHHTRGLPEARRMFGLRFERRFASNEAQISA